MHKQARFALLALVPWLLAWAVTLLLFSLGGPTRAVSTLSAYFFWVPNIFLPVATFAACNVLWFTLQRYCARCLQRDPWVAGGVYALISSFLAACLGLAVAPAVAVPVMTWVVLSGYWGFAWTVMACLYADLVRSSSALTMGPGAA